MSIRLRLTIWHSTLFFISLVAFAAIVWFGTRAVLYNDIDSWLLRQAEGLDRFLQMETHGTTVAAVIEETREFSSGLPEGSGIQLFDAGGTLLFLRPDGPVHAAGDRPATLTHNSTPLRSTGRRVNMAGREFRFTMWRSLDDVERALRDLRFVLLTLIPVFLVASIAGGWLLSRRALRPVDEITQAARRISLQNLSTSLAVPPHEDELRRLCVAWNEMLHRLDVSAGRLKQFTADASHELRTPVALIRTTAELALRQERSQSEYRNALGKIRDKSEDLTNLIESLMELARADAEPPAFSWETIELADLFYEVQSQIELLIHEKQLEFNIQASSDVQSISGDRRALQRVLLILLDNAVKFTPAGGRVVLRANANANDNEVQIEVEDSGIGIAPGDVPRIFDRFFQADAARSGEGAGLGLSIAQWIVTNHNGRIEVSSRPNHGSVFRIVLPSEPFRHDSVAAVYDRRRSSD